MRLQGEKLLYLLIGETPSTFYKDMYLPATVIKDILPWEGSGPSMIKKCKLENGLDAFLPARNCNEQDFHKLLPNHVICAKIFNIEYDKLTVTLECKNESFTDDMALARISDWYSAYFQVDT